MVVSATSVVNRDIPQENVALKAPTAANGDSRHQGAGRQSQDNPQVRATQRVEPSAPTVGSTVIPRRSATGIQ